MNLSFPCPSLILYQLHDTGKPAIKHDFDIGRKFVSIGSIQKTLTFVVNSSFALLQQREEGLDDL